MHFQCLIEDLSGRILVEHVMDKLKKEGYEFTVDSKAFQGIGGFKSTGKAKEIKTNVYKGGLKKFKKDCPTYREIGKCKAEWARAIGQYMNLDANASPSFNRFVSELRSILMPGCE